MGRRPRLDAAGLWWHVMNRAVGRRAMFESDRDVRRFVERLASAVREGWIEVHAFVVMQTHFHILLVSTTGELSRTLHYLEAPYAQWFNRSRERDGPLHRGRFLAKRVESDIYKRRLVSYIDANPVIAGLAPTPDAYPHGSAYLFGRPCGPTWHSRWWIEEQVRQRTGKAHYEPKDYRSAFPPLETATADDPVTRVGGDRFAETGTTDFLIATTDAGRAAWLRDLALRADGTSALRPVVPVSAVHAAVQQTGLTTARIGRRKRKATEESAAMALLLRNLAGSTHSEVAAALDCSLPTAARLHDKGAALFATDERFADEVSRAMRTALDLTYGPWRY